MALIIKWQKDKELTQTILDSKDKLKTKDFVKQELKLSLVYYLTGFLMIMIDLIILFLESQ
jgi:hypothetical protein